MTLVSQFVQQPPERRPWACTSSLSRGVKFVDLACFSAVGQISACTSAKRLATPTPMRSAFLALGCRF